MSVHLKIKEQINTFIQAERNYRALDEERELLIDLLLNTAKEGKELSVVAVNDVTERMNILAKKHGFPLRKIVTKEMVIKFLGQKESDKDS
ncbi:MAG: YpbS family protein [Bacillaceae bacterium]|nr:YpbS family protein [Bacillaceae bacterium]